VGSFCAGGVFCCAVLRGVAPCRASGRGCSATEDTEDTERGDVRTVGSFCAGALIGVVWRGLAGVGVVWHFASAALCWLPSWMRRDSSIKRVAARPWVRAFWAERRLPAGVRGPVDWAALRRLRAAWEASVVRCSSFVGCASDAHACLPSPVGSDGGGGSLAGTEGMAPGNGVAGAGAGGRSARLVMDPPVKDFRHYNKNLTGRRAESKSQI
jgi:hypothetical protein